MNGQPDEALELIHIHAVSVETRSSINTVIYTTVLKSFAMARRSKDFSALTPVPSAMSCIARRLL